MLFQRFEDGGLAHHSYAVGCKAAGRLAIVDARRDVDVYLEFAATRGVTITDVLETHIHADYASGARELARRTGARLSLSGHDSGEDFQIEFEHEDIEHGDVIELGSVAIEALHTPGHTPEHLCFLVYDRTRSRSVPQILLSGDFLFVGSLGRPDLLGEQATRRLAGAMFDSVRERLASLPDGLEVHPAHGAGSLCGAGMSGRPSSTLGYERIANPYLDRDSSREAFVERLLRDVPPFPPYYRRMKRLNSMGPTMLEGLPGRQPLAASEFRALLDSGHVVIDLRDQRAYGRGHIPGSFAIPFDPDLSQWAAWVVPYDSPILLIPADPGQLDPAVRALVRVGLDDVRGYLDGGFDAWAGEGYPVAETRQLTPVELMQRLGEGGEIELVDVRTDEEWRAGHIDGARHIMGGWLADRLDELPRDGATVATLCASGFRSSVAASVLERAGFTRLANVVGGMSAWRAAGLPVSGSPA